MIIHVAKRLPAVAIVLAFAMPSEAHAISWSNCNEGEFSTLDLLSLEGTPHIALGEPVRVAATLSLAEALFQQSNDVDIVVEHKVNGHILPCMAPYVGSCTYERVLSLPGSDCELNITPNVACSGPFNRGVYNLDDTFTLVDAGAMLEGRNQITVRIYNHNRGDLLACARFEDVVERCDDRFPPCTGDDCEDHYCLANVGWGPEVCGNGVDDDGDRQTDELAAASGIEADCEDGLDDDCDGVVDASDPDCVERGSVLVEPTFVGAASCAQAGVQTLTLTVDNGMGVRTEVHACNDEGFFTSAASGPLTLTISGRSADGAWSSPPTDFTVSAHQSDTTTIALTCDGCP